VSLHGDLLDQARHLARREPKKPKQASLRRAVSAAYYAVFHLLIDAASRFTVRGSGRTQLRLAVSRAFDHGEMKSAASSFANGNLPSVLQSVVPNGTPPALERVCEAFIDLQQARHEADYDLMRTFTRREVQDVVERAERAFEDWKSVAGSSAADAYLVALLLRKRLNR
jgi:uncharacterized protein (UPF0332 family)